MSKTKTVYFNGLARYARVFVGQEDTGANLPEGDQKRKFQEAKGFYTMDVVIDAATKKKMIADGIPGKGMSGQLFKEVEDKDTGEDLLIYRVRREVFNPKLTDKETGEQGVFMGAPKVIDKDGKEWDREEMGDIGNDSAVTVKATVWGESKVTLQAVKVNELVEYHREDNGGF